MSSRILTLEEDPVRVAELRQALEIPGHKLFSFSSTAKALDFLSSSQVDLILCDVHLETSSAFDFLKDVKKINRASGSPFLFYCIEPSQLTKPFARNILSAAKKMGARDVLFIEDFDADIMCTTVEQYLPFDNTRKCA